MTDEMVRVRKFARNGSKCLCRLACSKRSCLNASLQEECTNRTCGVDGGKCGNRFVQEYDALSDSQKRQWHLHRFVISSSNMDGVGDGLFAEKLFRKGENIVPFEEGPSLTQREATLKNADAVSRKDHLYCMQTHRGHYIDTTATYAGVANHSCEPNSEAVKIRIAGKTRVVLRALQEIERGVEITYNYGWENTKIRIKCKCGSLNCTNEIGAPPPAPKRKMLAAAQASNRPNREKKPVIRKSRADTTDVAEYIKSGKPRKRANINKDTGSKSSTKKTGSKPSTKKRPVSSPLDESWKDTLLDEDSDADKSYTPEASELKDAEREEQETFQKKRTQPTQREHHSGKNNGAATSVNSRVNADRTTTSNAVIPQPLTQANIQEAVQLFMQSFAANGHQPDNQQSARKHDKTVSARNIKGKTGTAPPRTPPTKKSKVKNAKQISAHSEANAPSKYKDVLRDATADDNPARIVFATDNNGNVIDLAGEQRRSDILPTTQRGSEDESSSIIANSNYSQKQLSLETIPTNTRVHLHDDIVDMDTEAGADLNADETNRPRTAANRLIDAETSSSLSHHEDDDDVSVTSKKNDVPPAEHNHNDMLIHTAELPSFSYVAITDNVEVLLIDTNAAHNKKVFDEKGSRVPAVEFAKKVRSCDLYFFNIMKLAIQDDVDSPKRYVKAAIIDAVESVVARDHKLEIEAELSNFRHFSRHEKINIYIRKLRMKNDDDGEQSAVEGVARLPADVWTLKSAHSIQVGDEAGAIDKGHAPDPYGLPVQWPYEAWVKYGRKIRKHSISDRKKKAAEYWEPVARYGPDADDAEFVSLWLRGAPYNYAPCDTPIGLNRVPLHLKPKVKAEDNVYVDKHEFNVLQYIVYCKSDDLTGVNVISFIEGLAKLCIPHIMLRWIRVDVQSGSDRRAIEDKVVQAILEQVKQFVDTINARRAQHGVETFLEVNRDFVRSVFNHLSKSVASTFTNEGFGSKWTDQTYSKLEPDAKAHRIHPQTIEDSMSPRAAKLHSFYMQHNKLVYVLLDKHCFNKSGRKPTEQHISKLSGLITAGDEIDWVTRKENVMRKLLGQRAAPNGKPAASLQHSATPLPSNALVSDSDVSLILTQFAEFMAQQKQAAAAAKKSTSKSASVQSVSSVDADATSSASSARSASSVRSGS